ncbi:hypothetical protein JHK82_046131 [Glycine max]|nr:hypothetical protein JHK86_044467 [Glycine max]KAG4951194.1 hypothetical protein JHK85_045061 [Glycine max]KAG5101079.1 hypothetical protein JHK82_046131 [Glycine max]KAG5107668.1 hypothetical protein JHK84_044575 [Glycine max]
MRRHSPAFINCTTASTNIHYFHGWFLHTNFEEEKGCHQRLFHPHGYLNWQTLQLRKKDLDERSMFLKHQLFLHLQMLCYPMIIAPFLGQSQCLLEKFQLWIFERRLMTSMSLLLKIITDFWLLKRKINSRRLEKSEKRKRLLVGQEEPK